MTEPCKFEPDIVMLKSDLPKLEQRLTQKINENREAVLEQHKEVKKSIDKLTDLIRGTERNPGLITKVILNCKSISRIWWFIGIIIVILIGIFGSVTIFK